MKILNFGSLNLDLVYTVDHAVRPGETIASSSLEYFCGGKGLNQSLALSRAGAQVFHAGCIGTDGATLKTILNDSGVNTDFIRQVDSPSGHAVIQLDKEGQNSIFLFQGANGAITQSHIDDVLRHFQPGDLLILQNEINHLSELLVAGAEAGLRIAMNLSPFSPELLNLPLDLVSYFVVNEIEGQNLTGQSNPEKLLDQIRKQYPKAATLLTLGTAGSVYDDGTHRYYGSCIPVEAVDTTGAGDTFLGYFFANLDQVGPQRALQLASAASALAVTVKGAANSIPTATQAEDFLLANQ